MRISGKKQLTFLSNLVYTVFRILSSYMGIKDYNYPKVQPCIYALWHGHQCCLHAIKDKFNLNILISRSIDGEIITRIVEKWGYKVVRGSKGKKGAIEATMKLVDRLKSGECAAIMVDGPSGPANVVKEGIIKIAKMAGAPIIPLYMYSPDFTMMKLPSWDGFRFPFVYARAMNIYGDPIYVSKDNTNEQDEQVRVQLQNALEEFEKNAPNIFKENFGFKLWKKRNEKNI